MANTNRALRFTVLFSFLALVGRLAAYIAIPPYIDAFSNSSVPLLNISNITDANNTDIIDIFPADPSGKQISVFFIILGQFLTSALIFGSILLMILILNPHQLKDARKNYSHRNIFISGFSQGISGVLMTIAMSGTRTPPYLQALLANFTVPVQFIVRFLVLRKRSTWLRVTCAGAVVLAEFISLIPSIFPGLESASQKKEDGGATGAGRFLWPLSMILSQIPYALANALMEGSVQGPQTENTTSQATRYDTKFEQTSEADDAKLLRRPAENESQENSEPQINIFYYGFFWSLSAALTACAFFWTDFLPHVGTTQNIYIFGKTLAYNARCMVGLNGCGPEVFLLGWTSWLSCFVATLGFTGLMRYSEGANFVIILLSLRTPIVFLFWTLFDERPLVWHPHLSLGTWLSIFSVVIMFPAIVIYQIGLPKCAWLRKNLQRNNSGILAINEDEDLHALNRDHQPQFNFPHGEH